MSKPRGFSQEWVDYFIPETVSYDPQTGWPNLDDAVMRNLIAVDLGFEHGLPDQTIVDRLEVASSIKRLHELERNPIPGNYDLAHMQRIHHHLFQDVYPWAGEIRTAPRDWPMTKLGPNVKAHLAVSRTRPRSLTPISPRRRSFRSPGENSTASPRKTICGAWTETSSLTS
ncbi:hypothetical protein GS471_21750 [Rhodococcus hoagii]|nr:hypothetical protein [Prescottella equi]